MQENQTTLSKSLILAALNVPMYILHLGTRTVSRSTAWKCGIATAKVLGGTIRHAVSQRFSSARHNRAV